MPKVSVIIPTYNREEYICETIESVLNQTYTDFEVIVVDDGSKDNTLKVIEKYKSKIKVVEQVNSERAVARNNGVKNSTGEYIAFVDSDDIWVETKLEKQVKILDEKKSVVLTYCASGRIDENSKIIQSANRQLNGLSGNVFESLLFKNLIVSATPLIRRSLFDKSGGFEHKYVPYEDWQLWIKLSLEGDFYFLPEILTYYRVHSAQSVQNISAEKIEKVSQMLLEDSYVQSNLSKKTINKSRSIANLRYCYWYIINGKFNEAKKRARLAYDFYNEIIFDPRWIGLRMISQIPLLNKVLKVEKLHAKV